ncbi:MAG: hypothetical protein ACR2HZ_08985 [Gemmatimonadaceae bacterium]
MAPLLAIATFAAGVPIPLLVYGCGFHPVSTPFFLVATIVYFVPEQLAVKGGR